MQGTIAPAQPGVEQVGRVSRLRSRVAKRIYLVAAVVGGVVAGSSPAYAVGSSTDLTGGQADTFLASLKSFYLGHIVVAVLALVAAIIGIGMLVRNGRKAANGRA